MVLRGADGTRAAQSPPRPAKYAPAVKTNRTETMQSSRNSIGADPRRRRRHPSLAAVPRPRRGVS
jgi:hypothetical protein